MTQASQTPWTSQHSAELYGIDQWGRNHFSVAPNGDLLVHGDFANGDVAISLPEILQGAQERGHELPLLIRIENFLDARISLLNESFATAIADADYKGRYNGVFPVKVNQQCAVIEEIVRFGARYGHGLEAGSKPELLLCLANLKDQGLLICNGYKDRDFIDLGLWANKLGHRCFFVIESPNELPLIIERSRALNIAPRIGLRIKVSVQVGGLWTETSGDRSSFGLSTAQLMTTVDTLKQEGMLDSLQLLHCHLGSQIPDLDEIRNGVREASRFYADLAAEGVPLQYIDLGGGLAVDYIGNQSKHSHSRNYNLADYCHCIVETIKHTVDAQNIPHPTIITESGRATVAHTTMLLFNILDVMRFEPLALPDQQPQDLHPLIARQYEIYQQVPNIDLATGYQEALENRDNIRDLFRTGKISLRHRAIAENLFLAIARIIAEQNSRLPQQLTALSGIENLLADIYYGNFSVFQSLPDSWAIDQVFPIVPIQRLNEKPDRLATISDLTCDCDGKLDHFILGQGERQTLPLHTIGDEEDYVLGVFLMGAYQETLGDLHNLFGDTNVISIRINEDGCYDVMKEQSGDSISEVLAMLEYNPAFFYENFRHNMEHAVRQKQITIKERQQLLKLFSAQLQNQTYFNY